MLPLFMVLLTSLAGARDWATGADAMRMLQLEQTLAEQSLAASPDVLAPPAYSILQGCAAGNGGLTRHWALPCDVGPRAVSADGPAVVWGALDSGISSPHSGSSLAGAQGGFLHLDLLPAHYFGAGPEVSWVTPDRPHDDLLRQRQVAPGIGVWYSPVPSVLFLGISANTQVSTLGETWFVNAVSSEARCGLSL